jgi:hypothetical protein
MTRRSKAKPPTEPFEITREDVDDICGLIDWAVDAIAYDKTMAREHLANAKKLLRCSLASRSRR